MSDFRCGIVFNTENICADIQCKQNTRKDIALVYALALRAQAAGVYKPDWPAISRAIIDRWGMNALEWITARALKLAKGEIVP